MGSLRRTRLALAALVGVTVFGTVGYLLLGFTLLEALYQTVTTVATVGFREVRPLGTAGQLFTIVLILLGVGTALYTFGVLMEAVIEGHLTHHIERRRMDTRIAALRGHVVICGYGRVGASAAEFLHAGGHQIVVVDADPDRLAGLDPDTPLRRGRRQRRRRAARGRHRAGQGGGHRARHRRRHRLRDPVRPGDVPRRW